MPNTDKYLPELAKVTRYDPVTGNIFWTVPGTGRRITRVAGSISNRGYRVISMQVLGRCIQIFMHRLAWFQYYGKIPGNILDHINGIPSDNRISNLRLASTKLNAQNKKCHREGHLFGTTYRRDLKKWAARIKAGKIQKHLGYFQSQKAAHAAYLITLFNNT